jgi:hypothetical protein
MPWRSASTIKNRMLRMLRMQTCWAPWGRRKPGNCTRCGGAHA